MRLTDLAPDVRLWCDQTAASSDRRAKQRIIHPLQMPVSGRIIRVEVMPRGQLARPVVKRSNARATGYMPSLKMGRMVPYESPYELMLARLFDIDSEAGAFRSQPAVIDYELNGVKGRHYPDFLQESKKQVFWEVKTFADAMSPEVSARSALMTRDLPTFGFEYRNAFAEDLIAEPRRDNILKLFMFARDAPDYCAKSMLDVAWASPFLTWDGLRKGKAAPLTAPIACHMVISGLLHFCIDVKWADDSQFMPAKTLR